MSMAMRSWVLSAMCGKRRPVPQPTSSTVLFFFRVMLRKAASIFAFCSSAY